MDIYIYKGKYIIKQSGLMSTLSLGNFSYPRKHHDIFDEYGFRRITNFDKKDKPYYQKAIDIYSLSENKCKLEIREDSPYALPNGKVLQIGKTHCSLWASNNKDLSVFWSIYRNIKILDSK